MLFFRLKNQKIKLYPTFRAQLMENTEKEKDEKKRKKKKDKKDKDIEKHD